MTEPPEPYDTADVLRSASLAEVAWSAGDRLEARAVTPLVGADGRPVLALPYAHARTAREVAASPEVLLSVTDPRMAGSGWRPLAVRARPRLVEDLDGSRFTEGLLDQELRKHPPSRARADSLLLRTEHWWFLPRLLVELDVLDVVPLAARDDPAADALLVARHDRRLVVAVVRVVEEEGADEVLRHVGGEPAPDGAPALVLRHDASVPDLETWVERVVRGRLAAGRLTGVEGERGAPVVGPPPGLLTRVRRHRAFERACRRGLAAAGG